MNFNGRTTATPSGTSAELLAGFNDWTNIKLNQIGARRNVGGPFFDTPGRQVLGPLSISMGRWDFGRWDFASANLGRWDFGHGDASRGDLGQGDYGRWDFGRWDFGRWDFGQPTSGRGDDARGYLGGGDMFVGDPNNTGGELDFETATDLARTPPNEFQACMIGVDCVGTPSPFHRVLARWTASNVGGVSQYTVYRVAGDALVPGQTWTPVATVATVPGQNDYAAVDAGQLVNGGLYTYFIIATYSNGVQSDPSNLVTIVGVNEPPVAADDGYSVAEDASLNQAAPGVLANDADPDTPSTLTGRTRDRTSAWNADVREHGRVHVHAGRELQRRGFVHLSGERRSSYDKRRDGHNHRDISERQPGHQQHRRSHDRREHQHGADRLHRRRRRLHWRRGLGDIEQHSARAGGESRVWRQRHQSHADRHARRQPEWFDNHHGPRD